jgi:hypothetical protein
MKSIYGFKQERALEGYRIDTYILHTKMSLENISNGEWKMAIDKKALGLKAVVAAIAASGALAGAAAAHAESFSFGGVEYLPSDQRVPAAQAFVADQLTPGTPVASALHILRKADAYCRTPGQSGATITCTHASFERHAEGADLVDVKWIVKVTPSADGTVAHATVSRSTDGF